RDRGGGAGGSGAAERLVPLLRPRRRPAGGGGGGAGGHRGAGRLRHRRGGRRTGGPADHAGGAGPVKPVAGLVLGERYELTERLAIGGMGEGWVATDLSLRRHVAAKVLREEVAGDQHFLDRLRAEAVNYAALTHQNIAAMYDYGEQRGSG